MRLDLQENVNYLNSHALSLNARFLFTSEMINKKSDTLILTV